MENLDDIFKFFFFLQVERRQFVLEKLQNCEYILCMLDYTFTFFLSFHLGNTFR